MATGGDIEEETVPSVRDIEEEIVQSVQDSVDANGINVSLQTEDMRRTCSHCSRHPDHFYCMECKLRLCKDCKKLHSSWPMLKQHAIIESTAEDLPDYRVCEKHPTLLVKHYCQPCGVKTCPECQITDHYLHESSSLESRVGSITEDFERVIQTTKDLIGKYTNNLNELRQQENDFTQETQRLNDLLNEEKQKLINGIVEKYTDTVKSNEGKLAAFREEINEKANAIQEEILVNESHLNDLLKKQSSLTIKSDLSTPHLPLTKVKEFEATPSPKITKCSGDCVTDGVIRCTVKNIDDVESGKNYSTEEFKVKQSMWKLGIHRSSGIVLSGSTLKAFAIGSTIKGSVGASITVRLLHPTDGNSKELKYDETFPISDEIQRELCNWQELASGGYVKNNEIVVELEVHPQTADGVACLCQNKLVWNTEITIPED